MLNNIVDNQVGSTTLFKSVFINPEQVVRFYACTLLRCRYAVSISFHATDLNPVSALLKNEACLVLGGVHPIHRFDR